jgi:pyruvate dehydrogenase E2 component (dihydrolipoamide acetyltransferase)
MASAIQMPKLSDTMTEGVIQKWLVKEGDRVSAGDPLAEVETDKATLEMEAYDAGTVLKLVAEAGKPAQVGAPIAVLGPQGADWRAALANGAPAPVAAEVRQEPPPGTAHGETSTWKPAKAGAVAAVPGAGEAA